jgi:hypothetical protein
MCELLGQTSPSNDLKAVIFCELYPRIFTDVMSLESVPGGGTMRK